MLPFLVKNTIVNIIKGDDKVNLKNKTLKEKVAYFVKAQKETMDYGETFYEAYSDVILSAFLKDYDKTCDFIKTANGEELDCFIYILHAFIKKYPNEEIIQLCVDRKAEIDELESDFESEFFFNEEIADAKKIISNVKQGN